jgi:BASS family bile acid:Na+ symporter
MFILERFLIVWLSLLSLLAYQWPNWFPESGDPWKATTPYLSYLITIIMFAVGWLLPRDEFRQVRERWPSVVFGTIVQYTSMPALAVFFAWLFQLDREAMIGTILVGCVPGAMASNVLTMLGRGNTSYSVSLTTCSTLLSPIVVPLALKLCLSTGEKVDIDLLSVSRNLALTVVVPVVVGHLLSRRFPQWENAARKVGSIVANLAIIWLIAAVVGGAREKLQFLTSDIFWALICLNLGGYLAGDIGARIWKLPYPMRRALTLEIGMQNAGLGATLATRLFADQPAISVPPALYTFGCMFTGALLAQIWATYDDVRGNIEIRNPNDESMTKPE